MSEMTNETEMTYLDACESHLMLGEKRIKF